MERRLKVLKYPNPEEFDVKDKYQCRQLVYWLENNINFVWDNQERESLRNFQDDSAWRTSFEKYLQKLECPIIAQYDYDPESVEVLTWLLGFSVKYQYFQTADDHNQFSKNFLQSKTSSSKGPLESFDYQSPDFKEGVKRLSEVLRISPHDDHLVTLEACRKLVEKRLNADARKNASMVVPKGESFDLKDHDMGFGGSIEGSEDPVLLEAAKILKLVHLDNLRDLQSRVNNTIEEVQKITGNPKTNTKLGKVGR